MSLNAAICRLNMSSYCIAKYYFSLKGMTTLRHMLTRPHSLIYRIELSKCQCTNLALRLKANGKKMADGFEVILCWAQDEELHHKLTSVLEYLLFSISLAGI